MQDLCAVQFSRSHGATEDLARFNGTIHDEDGAILTRLLSRTHPRVTEDSWFVATSHGQIVAALGLHPVELRIEDEPFRAAEMTLVGTLPEWRGQGLSRRLVEMFDAAAAREGYDFGIIAGIPGFYSKFGYRHSVPLVRRVLLPLENLPEGEPSARVRLAQEADIPFLAACFATESAPLSACAPRSRELWDDLLFSARERPAGTEYWILEDEGEARGYFAIDRSGFPPGLCIVSGWTSHASHWRDAMRHQGILARARGHGCLRMATPDDHPLTLEALRLDGFERPSYAWQSKVFSPQKTIAKFQRLLERRLARSLFVGHSGSFVLGFYSHSLKLAFSGGSLTAVEPTREPPQAEMPAELLSLLLLGVLDRGRGTHPEVSVERDARWLFDVLFPPGNPFFHLTY